MPGIRLTEGADLQLSNLRLVIGEDGTVSGHPLTVKLRTDMWPHWLAEAIAAAVLAEQHALGLREAVAAKDDDAVNRMLVGELRSSLRAITSAAFAVDAFYSSVKERSPSHPHLGVWRQKRTSRHVQISETLRYHLKLREPGASEFRKWTKDLFKFRGWAVHPGSKYREPIEREDVDAGVDWHFMVFRAANAAAATAGTVAMMDRLVSVLYRGGEELQAAAPAARGAMDKVIQEYEDTSLPHIKPRPATEPE